MARLDAVGRERLVEGHLRLAYYLARRFHHFDLELEDLEQEAVLGLCAASQVYDPDGHRGVPFSAFARDYVIRQLSDAIARHVRSSHSPLPREVAAPGPSAPGDRLAAEVWDVIEGLPARERALLVRRFGLDGGEALDLITLADRIGLSVRTATRVLASARELVAAELRSRGWTERSAAAAANLAEKIA